MASIEESSSGESIVEEEDETSQDIENRMDVDLEPVVNDAETSNAVTDVSGSSDESEQEVEEEMEEGENNEEDKLDADEDGNQSGADEDGNQSGADEDGNLSGADEDGNESEADEGGQQSVGEDDDAQEVEEEENKEEENQTEEYVQNTDKERGNDKDVTRTDADKSDDYFSLDEEDGTKSDESVPYSEKNALVTENNSEEEEEEDMPSAKRAKTDNDDNDTPFYGFDRSEIPERVIIIPDGLIIKDLDLSLPFDMDLLQNPEEDVANVLEQAVIQDENKEPVLKAIIVQTPTKPSTDKTEAESKTPSSPNKSLKIIISKSPARPQPQPQPLPSLMARESREWKPSAQFFKPLAAGWIRELVYDRDEAGNYATMPKEVNYYAPKMPGVKPRKFKYLSELGTFLSSALSEFTLNNFSFRKEPMNAPQGQEISRATDEEVNIFPPKPDEPTPTAPKRKSNQMDSHDSPKSNLTSKQSGILKVKVFSKMAEENIAGTPKIQDPSTDDDEKSNAQQTTIFEKPGIKLKIRNNTSTTHLSSPKVTITPAVRPAPSVSINPVQNQTKTSMQLPSGTTIQQTIVSKSSQVARRSNAPKSSQVSSPISSSSIRILRPTKMSKVVCSIHCPMTTNYPELSCVSCHSLFHPKCIGLHEGVNYSSYDFYCYACTPPPGKENNGPQFKNALPATPEQQNARSKSLTGSSLASTFAAALPPNTSVSTASTGLVILPAQSSPQHPNQAKSPMFTFSVNKKPMNKVKKPIIPLESQGIVNIGGIKYLVIPRLPQGDTATSITGITGSKTSTPDPGKLPIFLAPTPEEKSLQPDLLYFDVLKTPDGQYLLHPIDQKPISRTPLTYKRKDPVADKLKKLHDDCTYYFFTLVHLFQYFTVAQVLNAAKVSKIWNAAAFNRNVWKSIRFDDCLVNDVKQLCRVVGSQGTSEIDFKKVDFKPELEDAWEAILAVNASHLTSVTRLEFQKLTSIGLQKLGQAFSQFPESKLTSLVVKDVFFGVGKDTSAPLCLTQLNQLNRFDELKLRSLVGNLSIDSRALKLFVLNYAKTLKILSLLTVDSLTTHQVLEICSLQNLSCLELGNCGDLAPEAFEGIGQLSKLNSLRIEKGALGKEIEKWGNISTLENLELINVEMKSGFGTGLIEVKSVRKILLIPAYKDEAALTNAEMVDSISSLSKLTHFFLGITNEWLDNMAAVARKGNKNSNPKEISPATVAFPILINNDVQFYTLTKFSKLLVKVLPSAKRVKILKMSRKATTKQFLVNMKK